MCFFISKEKKLEKIIEKVVFKIVNLPLETEFTIGQFLPKNLDERTKLICAENILKRIGSYVDYKQDSHRYYPDELPLLRVSY